MTKLLISLLITVSLSANIINLQTADTIGRVSFQTDSIVIVSENGLENFIPMTTLGTQVTKHCTVILCRTRECVSRNIAKYKNLYRTNGISVFTYKD